MTDILDGKAIAGDLRTRIAVRVGELRDRHAFVPTLAVILVGDDPASAVYVRNKDRALTEAGMSGRPHHLPAETAESDLLALIRKLNDDPQVDGILVQLPLPAHIRESAIVDAIDPDKDVDGFHVVNAGRLARGGEGLVPCTPLGCMMLLKRRFGDLAGKEALVLGRSNIVGRPMAQLLLRANATVTIAHSKSRDLPALCRRAEILVAAVGRPLLVKGGWIGPGATVIDVGINRIEVAGGRTRLVGDVDFEGAQGIAGAITPVPGGVGPMTIACLLANTLKAAVLRRGLPHGLAEV